MSLTLRPIEQLQADWDACGRTPASATAMARLAAREPLVAELGLRDLGELVAWLRAARFAQAGSPSPTAAAVVRCMLRGAEADPMVPRAIVQALLPGLVGVARRLSWGRGGDWDGPPAFLFDLLATTWELVRDWAGDDRPYAVVDLLSAARCRMRREVERRRVAARRHVVGLDADAFGSEPWRRGPTDLDELASALVDLAQLDGHRRDAAVLYAHRVLGYSLTELARRTGRSRRRMVEARDRATRLLTA